MFMAFIHRRLGMWELSISEARSAVELDPQNVEKLFNLGTSHWLLREYEKADTWLDDGPARVLSQYTIDIDFAAVLDVRNDADQARLECTQGGLHPDLPITRATVFIAATHAHDEPVFPLGE